MKKNQKELKCGLVDIHGPTASDKACSIFENLAELFECETNTEAADTLVKKWNFLSKKGKLDLDSESDYVSIRTSKTHIVDLAVLINELSGNTLEKKDISSAKKEVKSWKQPEAFLWDKGDVFYIKISDSVTVYGQVLDKTSYNAPTCVLFSYFTDNPANCIDRILTSEPITILHVDDGCLNDQTWVVFGREDPVLKPDSGPCGKKGAVGSIDWDGLETIARAWHGLNPWNRYYKDDYLDEMLLEGVSRPSNAVMLDRASLEKYGIKRAEWV